MTTARKNTSVAVVRDIPLKRIHDDVLKANPASKLTTKDMRRWLRAQGASFDHARNASWTFASGKEYDLVRAKFDPKYAAKIAPKKVRAPKKAPVVTPAETPVEA